MMSVNGDHHGGGGAAADSSSSSPVLDYDAAAEKELERERTIAQATDEGHDADIPSGAGYILDEMGELKRRRSIAEHRRHSLARRASRGDLERGGAGSEPNAEEPQGDKDAISEDEANVVWWDGPDDPENPHNWPTWKKFGTCGLISGMTFLTPLASSIFAPGVPELMIEFGSDSEELAAFVVSVYVLGFAFGPLLFAPLSEIYGRTIVYHCCNVGFLCFVVGCALAPSLNTLIAFRFLSGIFGACPITNGGGSIADMIEQEKRGAAMAVFSVGPLLGPIIGPVAGGFLAAAKGWRWVFWLLVIIGGALALLMLFALRETYVPVILNRKVARLQKETGNDLLRSKLDVGLSPRDYFGHSIVRPLKMLARSPIVAIFALYMAVVYGYLYLLFTSVTEVFEEYYHFSANIVGLVYLGLGVGSMIGLIIFSLSSDRNIKKKAAKYGQGMKPEYRLQPLTAGAVLLPCGFFLYGWTAQYHVHWIVPILGTVVIGVGNLIIFMALQMYLVDAFAIYAASALAANTVVRSIAGAVLPLAGLQMYAKLGMGWGNSLLGFIAVGLIPVPLLILKYGEYLRKRFELKNI